MKSATLIILLIWQAVTLIVAGAYLLVFEDWKNFAWWGLLSIISTMYLLFTLICDTINNKNKY